MRSTFPVIWIFQFILLALLSVNNFIRPIGVLEFHRGKRAPVEVEKPSDALYRWVLSLEEIPPANSVVREFFREHKQRFHESHNVWTPHDPAIAKFLAKSGQDPESAVVHNRAWEDVETWILSATPPPPPHEIKAIKQWIDAVDQVPAASATLAARVDQQQGPQDPDIELRLMILEARQTQPISWRLASDQIRLTAPSIMAAALFTLLGLMSPSIRRPLARVFVFIALFWTFAQLTNSTGPHSWNLTTGILVGGLILAFGMAATAVKAVPRLSTGATLLLIIAAWWVSVLAIAAFANFEQGNNVARVDVIIAISLVSVLGIANAYYWLIGQNEDPPQDDAGIAQRRPPQLWTTWLVQFSILLTSGLIALIFPSWVAELFVNSNYDYLASDIVDDSVRLLGSWTIAAALFSYFALGVKRDWIWQGIGLIFCVVFFVLACTTLVYGSSGEYTVWAFLYGCQGVIFIPITIHLLTKKDPWTADNVERVQTDDGKLTDIVVGPILMWRPLWSGHRALYRNGVAASGRLTVLPTSSNAESDEFTRPEHEFFVPGAEFDVQMRFSNRISADDAELDIRGCALRFSKTEDSPLNLMFATGAFAPYSTLFDFRRILPRYNQRKLIQRNKIAREGFAAGLRRAPSSYAALTYHDHFTLEWLTPSAQHYLVRFRVVPNDAQNEDNIDLGLPDSADLQHLWQRERRGDDTRRPDYLRQELVSRVSNSQQVAFELQAQFHEPSAYDSHDWFDASLEWDEEFAWHPLAEITLDQPLSDEEGELLRFDPSCLPRSLHVPNPEGLAYVADPRALAAARFRVAHFLGRWRLARRRLFSKGKKET